MCKHTGQDPEVLYKLPKITPECLYLYSYYCEVRGQEPLTYREVESWAKLMGNELTPDEVKMLFALDNAFFEVRQG